LTDDASPLEGPGRQVFYGLGEYFFSEIPCIAVDMPHYKEGDDRTEGTDIENSNPQQLTQESSNMQTYNQHVYRFDEENQEVKNIERRADKIRTYSIRRFVKVQNLDGEPRMGYHDEKGVFYFSVATLMFMEHHTTACNCSNCQWICDYDEELNYAYDGFNNTSTA
jgi:hypothetical protein